MLASPTLSSRRVRWLTPALVLSVTLGLTSACRSNTPDGRAESQCYARCQSDLASRCNEDQCVRGCRFILDRLVEHEGRNVIACMARGGGEATTAPSGTSFACDDEAWASCAAKIGIHTDGGPPAPPPPNDDFE